MDLDTLDGERRKQRLELARRVDFSDRIIVAVEQPCEILDTLHVGELGSPRHPAIGEMHRRLRVSGHIHGASAQFL